MKFDEVYVLLCPFPTHRVTQIGCYYRQIVYPTCKDIFIITTATIRWEKKQMSVSCYFCTCVHVGLHQFSVSVSPVVSIPLIQVSENTMAGPNEIRPKRNHVCICVCVVLLKYSVVALFTQPLGPKIYLEVQWMILYVQVIPCDVIFDDSTNSVSAIARTVLHIADSIWNHITQK